MTIDEKLNTLNELLDIEEGTLNEETELARMNEWDSIAIITIIAMFDSLYEKEISPEEVKSFKTIKDITDRME